MLSKRGISNQSAAAEQVSRCATPSVAVAIDQNAAIRGRIRNGRETNVEILAVLVATGRPKDTVAN